MAGETSLFSRFLCRSEVDIDKLIEEKVSKSTKSSTKNAVKILREFCVEKGLQTEFENLTAVAVEVLLKCCINSFAHKNKLIWQLMELFTNLKNLIILVTSCFVVIGHLCQS